MITCKEASRALSQMQDGELAYTLHLRIRLHLLLCDACTRFARQLRFLHRAMQHYRH